MLFSEFYRSKEIKFYKIWTKETVFIYIFVFVFSGVSRTNTNLDNIWFNLFGYFLNKFTH